MTENDDPQRRLAELQAQFTDALSQLSPAEQKTVSILAEMLLLTQGHPEMAEAVVNSIGGAVLVGELNNSSEIDSQEPVEPVTETSRRLAQRILFDDGEALKEWLKSAVNLVNDENGDEPEKPAKPRSPIQGGVYNSLRRAGYLSDETELKHLVQTVMDAENFREFLLNLHDRLLRNIGKKSFTVLKKALMLGSQEIALQ